MSLPWHRGWPILVAGALLIGCSQDNTESVQETANTPTAAQVPARPRHPLSGEMLAERQVFRYRLTQAPASLDPQRAVDTEAAFIARDLFEGLLSVDSAGEIVPGVAERYEISDDFQTWTFHLRDDARWSDGQPVTARDFVFAWRGAVDPQRTSPLSWYFPLMGLENSRAIVEGRMEPASLGVTAADDVTLQVQLTRPTPYLAHMVTHPATFPRPQWAIEAHGDDWLNPDTSVSNGAFVLTERNKDRLIRAHNEHYWDARSVYLDRVDALVLPDAEEALAQYQAGHLDKTELPQSHYARTLQERPVEVVTTAMLCTYDLTFNAGSAPFNDSRVRRALAFAIDRETLTNTVLQGPQLPAFTLTPTTTAGFAAPSTGWGHWTQAERERQAKTLMSEAGFGADNPLQIELLHNSGDPHREIAQAVAAMWREVLGVETTLVDQEWSAFLASRQRGDFEVARGGWCGEYNDASAFLNVWHSESDYNAASFQSTDYDLLLRQSRTTANPAAYYTQMERLLADLMPAAPLYHYAGAVLLKPQIGGWPVNEAPQNVYSKQLYRMAVE